MANLVDTGVNGDLRVTGNIYGALTGNASTATTWATGRDFKIQDANATNTGATVTGVNGSGNVTLKLPSTIKASLTGNATSSTYPLGFSSRSTSTPNWGKFSDSSKYSVITTWATDSAAIVFAKDTSTPSGHPNKTLSVQVDGYFYQNEGTYRVLDESDGLVFGLCTTAAGTAAKVASAMNYTASVGNTIMVRFTNTNSAAGALTLALGGQTKTIRWNGTVTTSGSTSAIPAGTWPCYYDGTYWNVWTNGATEGRFIGSLGPRGFIYATSSIKKWAYLGQFQRMGMGGGTWGTCNLIVSVNAGINGTAGRYDVDTYFIAFQASASDFAGKAVLLNSTANSAKTYTSFYINYTSNGDWALYAYHNTDKGYGNYKIYELSAETVNQFRFDITGMGYLDAEPASKTPITGYISALFPASITDNQVVLTNGTNGVLKTSAASSLSVGSATKATGDADGTNIKQNYMKASSGDKSITTNGGSVTIGTVNGSNVNVVLPTIASGTNNGTIKVGTTDNIAVKGLGSAAYTASTAYAPSSTVSCTTANVKSALGTGSGTSKYLREDGTWQTPPDHTYTVNNAALKIQINGGTATSKFTANASSDATLTFATGGNNGTIKVDGTEVAVKGLGTAAYTASTAYATSGHTHTTSIASDSSSGTVVSLAHNTQYKLTAGGTSVLFKTPADNNTDTNVTQTADNTSSGTGFEVLFSATGDNTTRTEGSRKSNKLTFQPSTGTLTATKFSGPLTGNVTGNCSGSSGSCTGNAATATKATQDSEGYNIKDNYMRTTSGNKILSFGGTTTIGKTNGSDVKLVMPEANADVYPVSANSTAFSDVLAAYNANKKLVLQIGFTLPGTTLIATYNIPLNRIVYSNDTPVIFVWVYTQDSLTGDTNKGVITTWSLGSTGWANQELYTYYSDTAGLSEKASALIDFGDTSRMTRVGWGGSSIGRVIASGSSTSLSESSYLAGYYVAEGMGHVKDVKAENVTVGNATKWNGWSIVVGSTGTDANTLYFV